MPFCDKTILNKSRKERQKHLDRSRCRLYRLCVTRARHRAPDRRMDDQLWIRHLTTGTGASYICTFSLSKASNGPVLLNGGLDFPMASRNVRLAVTLVLVSPLSLVAGPQLPRSNLRSGRQMNGCGTRRSWGSGVTRARRT